MDFWFSVSMLRMSHEDDDLITTNIDIFTGTGIEHA